MITKLEVKETNKYGRGVFALEDIKKGQIVYVINGERIPLSEVVKRINSGKENLDDIFQIGKRTYIDLNDFSRLFNHSCDPNTGIRKISEIVALRDIKKGEEITYDYSSTISPTVWEMECKCGTEKCRKVLGDVLSIPKEQLDTYKKGGFLQDYMISLLKEVGSGNYKLPKYEILALEKLRKGE